MEQVSKASWSERYHYGWQAVTFALAMLTSFLIAIRLELKVMKHLVIVSSDFLAIVGVGLPWLCFAGLGYTYWNKQRSGEVSRELAGATLSQIAIPTMLLYMALSQFAAAR